MITNYLITLLKRAFKCPCCEYFIAVYFGLDKEIDLNDLDFNILNETFSEASLSSHDTSSPYSQHLYRSTENDISSIH